MKQFLRLCLLMVLEACVLLNPDRPRKKPKIIKIETPPGTVWLRDNLFIDKEEVSNLDYLQFLWWVSQKDSSKYIDQLPDSTVWESIQGYDASFVRFYLRHPAYQDFPVVGVSYNQAIQYSNWRSDRINEMMYVRDNKIIWNFDSSYRFPVKVKCRLPSREEWEFAAISGLDYKKYPLGYQSIYKRDSTFSDYIKDNKTKWFSTVWVKSYKPNKFNVYHMLGNVSELTVDSLVKGLNFTTHLDGTSPITEIKFIREHDSLDLGYTIKSYMKYEKPAAWLGFRCVCEVK